MNKYDIDNKNLPSELFRISMHNRIFNHYLRWIEDLATSLFEWENLPDTCDSNYLEKTLFYHGDILFFDDNELGFLHLKYTAEGVDHYGRPINRRPIAENGNVSNIVLEVRNDDNSVIIKNNRLGVGDSDRAYMYAYMLYDIKMKMLMNINKQKFPYLLTSPKSLENTMKNIYKKLDSDEPVIFASDKLNEYTSVGVINTQTPFIASELQEIFNEILEEVLGYFGVNSVRDKKERMITSEVMNGIGQTQANRYIRLSERERAVEKINKMFGLDIGVKFRRDIDITESIMMMEIQSSLYDNDIDKVRVM